MAKKISAQQVAFLRFELERGDAKTKKVALQDLSALYRQGQFLPLDAVEDIETRINGLLLQSDQDLKVVRWGLNALARFGRLDSSRTYVETALKMYAGDPEIEAAGVAALCHIYRGSVDSIEALREIDPIIWKLAALQNTDPRNIDLNNLSIDIYNADPAVLRLALITVGLNRDIENLFHPRHSNNAFVRHLGQHSDAVVQQYSVWAVIENRKLVFEDVGISLESIDRLPANVQSKAYQLVAERDPDHRRRLSITEQGSSASREDAREGLSKGVKSQYYDGLESVTLDWYDQEKSPIIRGNLVEHFARFSNQCGPYEDMAMRINEVEPHMRERLRLGAEGKPLFSKLNAFATADLLTNVDAQDLGRAIRERTDRSQPRNVLMFTASPLDAGRMRLEAEQREISDRIKLIDKPKVKLEFALRQATRTKDILPHVLNSDAEVFHFSGHGTPTGLVFETDEGSAKMVSGSVVAGHVGSMSKPVVCVVLNACYSANLAAAFLSFASVVIGCDDTIDDDAAITFTTAFYIAMACGKDYSQCFVIAVRDVEANHNQAEAKKYVMKRR